jgi:hypothetical protein
MTVIYRAAPNGRLLSWSRGTGWLEVEASPPSASQPEDIEALMRGRTPEETESGRRALQRRAARRRQQVDASTSPGTDRGYVAASRPRPLKRVIVIEGGVSAT